MDPRQNTRLIPVFLAIFLIAACERQAYEPGSPEYVVHALYKASARGMPKEPEKLSQYFDGRMTELLVKDFTCIENGEPCGLLHFDPIAQSRTPDIDDLKIFKPEDSTEVFVSFMQRGVEYKAICVMVRTAAGWRISDIMYYGANQVLEPGASLLTHLALQTPLPAPWHPPVPGMSDDELEMLHL
jgi:hypothetical protein